MKDARIDIRIPHKTKDRWMDEADKRGLKLTALIIRNVERQLEQESAETGKKPALV